MREHNDGRPKGHTAQQGSREFAVGKPTPQLETDWEKIPHDELVLRMRKTIAREKARWETRWGKDTFDAVEWVSTTLNPYFRAQRSSQESDLSTVWNAISEPYLKHQSYRVGVRTRGKSPGKGELMRLRRAGVEPT